MSTFADTRNYLRRHTVLRRSLESFAVLVIVVVIAARLYLDVWLLDYVNNVLHNIKGYDGSVEAIHIDLYRGAYRIRGLKINKMNANIPTPFIDIDKADLSIQWSALFHGRVVSSIDLVRPTVNFAVKDAANQTGTEVDWTKPIKDLMPVDINIVTFKEGKVTYQDFASTPNVNIYIHNMVGEVHNLRNAEKVTEALPSPIEVRGDSIGHGRLEIKGKLNILKEVPDMNLNVKLENVNLPAINNYSQAYGAFDFKDGVFDLYSQLGVKDSQVSGYVKFLAHNVSVKKLENPNPLQAAWATVVATLITVFTNLPQDQFATRVDPDR